MYGHDDPNDEDLYIIIAKVGSSVGILLLSAIVGVIPILSYVLVIFNNFELVKK
jgi:hypothetical protein